MKIITFFDSSGTAFDFIPEIPHEENEDNEEKVIDKIAHGLFSEDRSSDEFDEYEFNTRRRMKRQKRNFKITKSMNLSNSK